MSETVEQKNLDMAFNAWYLHNLPALQLMEVDHKTDAFIGALFYAFSAGWVSGRAHEQILRLP